MLVKVIEAVEDLPATRCEERLFCGTPTLGNDITDVVIDSIFLQVEELWHTLHTLGLRNGTGHEHDVGARSYGMRPFDIKRGLEGPVNHVWITGVEFNRTQWGEYFEGWRIRQAIAGVKDMEIIDNGRTAERVNDDNRLTLAVKTSVEHRRYVISITHFLRAIAGNVKMATAKRIWRSLQGALGKTKVAAFKGDRDRF